METPMQKPWEKTMENSMGNPWKIHGKSMGNPWEIKTEKKEMFPWFSMDNKKWKNRTHGNWDPI